MSDTKEIFKKLDEHFNLIKSHLKAEYEAITAGRAMPSVLNNIMVDAYDVQNPLNQVASVILEGPQSLFVSPYDKSLASKIEMAINAADLGISASAVAEGVRVSFPPVTLEKREELKKLAKVKLEGAKLSIKPFRERVVNEMKAMEKDGWSQDEHKRGKVELQDKTDAFIKELEEIYKAKEKSLSE